MQASLAKLKQTNPDLASKMEKIGNKMEELAKSGTNPQDAMKSIQKEFGAPTKEEMAQLKAAGAEMRSQMPLQNSKLAAMLGGGDSDGDSDSSSGGAKGIGGGSSSHKSHKHHTITTGSQNMTLGDLLSQFSQSANSSNNDSNN